MFKLKLPKKLPRSVTIGGKAWKVTLQDLDGLTGKDDTVGLTVYDSVTQRREILIDKSLENDEQRMRVFLHELVHAIIFESKLPPDSICKTAEEVLCEQIAQLFFDASK
jgi:hypothetical protein